MSCITFQNIDKCFTAGEKAFNILGWVPFISSATGPVRMIAGKVMAIAAAVLAAATFAAGYIMNDQKLIQKADQFAGYIWHGLGNFVRGFIESIPIAGNLATILYDSEPDARMRYKDEPLPIVPRPLRA